MIVDEYLKDPCRTSSIPLWKAKRMAAPDSMRVIHEMDLHGNILNDYADEPYFRLSHTLSTLPHNRLPSHFSFTSATIDEFAKHINSCYTEVYITSVELSEYKNHLVYCQDLWLAIRDDRTGMIVGSGIGELDSEIGEGILEWVQVSKDYRGMGIGSCIV